MHLHLRHPRGATATGRGDRAAQRGLRTLSYAGAALLLVGLAATSEAATRVTVTNPGGLTAVGPVNAGYGFPAYYQDKAGVRVEPCLDADNPLCGFLPGDVPDPDQPISFPDNFPGEFFYQLVDGAVTLPGGGSATLTLGLEAAFANDEPISGDQVVFARTRVVVKGGVPGSTMSFKHPFGELSVDIDAGGRGRLVQDIAPAVGNFATPLGSNFGPFLKWDPSVAPAAPAGYLGDPAQPHRVVGGVSGYNRFTAFGANGAELATTDLFGVSGKVATNTGVTGDRAKISGGYLDVFATSTGDQLQVEADNGWARTAMSDDPASPFHYARLALDPTKPLPTSVTVTNIADKPVSTVTIRIPDVEVTSADYDGTALTVEVKATSYPVDVVGIGQVTSNAPASFDVTAPPASVTARSASGTVATRDVRVVGGPAFDPAPPVTPPAPDPGPIDDNTPDNPVTAVPTVSIATIPATLPGGSVIPDASGTTGATSYLWSIVSGPQGAALTGATTTRPTLTLPFAITNQATAPVPAYPVVTLRLAATNSIGTTTTDVTVPIRTDALTITAARHKVGTELRVDGTSLINGAAGVFTPPTQITVWAVRGTGAGTTYTKLGAAPVDTLGAWSLKLKPGPGTAVPSVLLQSSRGATATSALANR